MEKMNFVEFAFLQVRRFGLKHWKARKFITEINTHISGLRTLAFKKRGTYTANWCSREATRIEKELQRLQNNV